MTVLNTGPLAFQVEPEPGSMPEPQRNSPEEMAAPVNSSARQRDAHCGGHGEYLNHMLAASRTLPGIPRNNPPPLPPPLHLPVLGGYWLLHQWAAADLTSQSQKHCDVHPGRAGDTEKRRGRSREGTLPSLPLPCSPIFTRFLLPPGTASTCKAALLTEATSNK